MLREYFSKSFFKISILMISDKIVLRTLKECSSDKITGKTILL
jgi:hypothetical protein